MSSQPSPQATAYLQAQYPGGVVYPSSVAAAGYGGSPLIAGSSPYAGLAVAGQPSRPPTYGVPGPVAYQSAAALQSAPVPVPGYPGAAFGAPPY